MKTISCFFLLATVAISSGVTASSVAPSVIGTVTRVSTNASGTEVVLNGHTYTMSNAPGSTAMGGTLHAGQQVTLLLSSDGRTVITAVPAANIVPSHP